MSLVFPVKYLCLGVVPNWSSFPTTGTLLMSQRDHPWVWVQPILQQWMPLDKREEGVFLENFHSESVSKQQSGTSMPFCHNCSSPGEDQPLPGPSWLAVWAAGSVPEPRAGGCEQWWGEFLQLISTQQGWATSSFRGLPRLQGAVAPGESTDLFLSNLSLHLAEERM